MNPHSEPSQPPSPCVQVCLLDTAGAFCVGCGRSLVEIGEWSAASAARKHDILRLAEQRRAQLSPPGAR